MKSALLALLVLPVVLGLLGMHAMGVHAAAPAAMAGHAAVPGGHAAAQTLDDDAASCHPGCPPAGVAHSSDCIPAPGVQAPTLPAAVVLARSDAGEPGPAAEAAPPAGAMDAPPAPDLRDLSISRT